MARKKVATTLKLQIPAGQASPAPPIGPMLGQHGIDIGQFVSRFNEATAQMGGDVVPVEVTVYEDRSFDFNLKTPLAAALLKKAAGIPSGSATPHKEKVGSVTRDQVREIAERKMEDLTAHDIDQAVKIIEGTARSMGIEVR